MRKTLLWLMIAAYVGGGMFLNAGTRRVAAEDAARPRQVETPPPLNDDEPKRPIDKNPPSKKPREETATPKPEQPKPMPTPYRPPIRVTPTPNQNPSPTPRITPTPRETPRTTPTPGASGYDLRRAAQAGEIDGARDGQREGEETGEDEGRRRGGDDGYERGAAECRQRAEQHAFDLGFAAERLNAADAGRQDGLQQGRRDAAIKGAEAGTLDARHAAEAEMSAAEDAARREAVQRADQNSATFTAEAAREGQAEANRRALAAATADFYETARRSVFAAKLSEPARFQDSFAQPKPRQTARRPTRPIRAPRRRAAILSEPAFVVNTVFRPHQQQQEDIKVPDQLNKVEPDFKYRGNNNSGRDSGGNGLREERAEYERAYRRAYRRAWQDVYRDTFRRAYRRAFSRSKTESCRSITGYDYGDDLTRYENDDNYRRFVIDGREAGRRQGYDEQFAKNRDLAFEAAYQANYDAAFAETRRKILTNGNNNLEAIRRAEYDRRAAQIKLQSFDQAQAIEYKTKYRLFAEQQKLRGVKDETADLKLKPVRLIDATATKNADGEISSVTIKLRNFAAAPILASAVSIVFIPETTEPQSPKFARLTKNLRLNSVTEIKDVFVFKPSANTTKIKIRLLYKNGVVSETTIDAPQ